MIRVEGHVLWIWKARRVSLGLGMSRIRTPGRRFATRSGRSASSDPRSIQSFRFLWDRQASSSSLSHRQRPAIASTVCFVDLDVLARSAFLIRTTPSKDEWSTSVIATGHIGQLGGSNLKVAGGASHPVLEVHR